MQPGRSILVCFALAGGAALSGCGASRFTVVANIPAPMVSAMPLSVALRLPKAFTEYVQKDELNQSKLTIELGAAQASAFRKVTAAMFQRTLMLGDAAPDDAAQMAAQDVRALIEYKVDSYIYLQPTSGGSEFYSATIGYQLDLRTPDGQVLGSWIYEGYGSVPARGNNLKEGITRATALAIRDAGANIAVHLPQQEIIQNLLTPTTATTTTTTTTGTSTP
jgi:hypothetical protein